jgi:hypothetical protein
MKNRITNTTGPVEPAKRQILVVANETVEGAALRDLITLSGDGEPRAEVLVIVPALNSRLRHWQSDEDNARRRAGLRLDAALERLRGAGIDAEGRVGDADPLQAIADAPHEFGAREIVIATQGEGCSHWLTRDLVGRARRRFSQPVGRVVVEPSEDSELVSESTTRGRGARSVNRATAPRTQEANA